MTTIARVAVVYDDQVRPETTGTYCRRALKDLVHLRHLRPADLPEVAPGDFDLFVHVDDGLEYRWPARLRPSVWWAIDTHLAFDRAVVRSADFDLVFAAQRDGAAGLRRAGITTATWLPLACDPDLHRPHDVPLEHDVCFVGNIFPGERRELIEAVRRRHPRSFVGRRYFDEMARTYSASRTAFNRSLRNDVNMRIFEVLGCGTLLVTNDLAENGQAELFRDGEHLATYRDEGDLFAQLDRYLGDEDLRRRVAAAGRQEALARHTYRHRMRTLLETAERHLGRRLVAVGADVPQPASPSGREPRSATPNPPSSPAGAHSTGPDDRATHLEQRDGSRSATADRETEWTPPAFVDPAYYEFDRPEVLALIPPTARRVLEVGCGAGRLGESLQRRQPAEVTGIERAPAAAALARARLDRVVEGDLEGDLDLPAGPFDCVVCADVLEHLRRPDRVLRRLVERLADGGCVVASLPNVRHHSVVRALLEGHWTDEDAGLLDRTHLRFFAWRNVLDLCTACGLRVERRVPVPGPGHADWVRQGRPAQVTAGPLGMECATSEEAEEFFVYQWLLVARKVAAAADASPQEAAPR